MSADEEELPVGHDGSHEEEESQELANRHVGEIMNVAREEGNEG